MEPKRNDILLVGKTGHGKSATGNSIVGYRAFKSRSTQDAVTLTTQFEVGEFEGRILKVVDGPGVGDTRLDKKEGFKLVVKEISVAIAANPAGYHCILLVMRFGIRCTHEEIEVIQLLKKIFGDNFIRSHAILLITFVDSLANDDEHTTFESWVFSQTGYFKELVMECCGRVIGFDNASKDSKIKTEQMRKLMNMIDNLSVNGTRYTSDIFMTAKETRDLLLKKSTKKTLKDETMIECGLINQQLNCISFEDPENTIGVLRDLRKRTEKLHEDVKQQDQGTNSLSVAIKLTQQLTEAINENDKTAKEILAWKQKIQQMELQKKMEQVRLEEEEKKRKEDKRRRQEEDDKIKFEEQLEKQRQEHTEMLKKAEEEIKMELQKKVEQVRLEEEEKKRKEDKRRRQEEDDQILIFEEQLEQQRQEHEKMLKKAEEEIKKTMESVKESYETVKNEEVSWTWGDVANAVVGYATTFLNWWLQK